MNISLAETMDGTTVQWMKAMAMQQKIILTGSAIIEEEGKFYNRLLWVLPNGTVAYYNKRHLFAFAGENQFYASGNKRLIAAVNGWKINLQICYDLRFPELIRNRIEENGQAAYDVLLYVANWPKKRVLHWSSLLQARAIENLCYTIGVNRVGIDGNEIVYPGASAVYNGLGTNLIELDDQETVRKCILSWSEIQEMRVQLPFLKDRK